MQHDDCLLTFAAIISVHKICRSLHFEQDHPRKPVWLWHQMADFQIFNAIPKKRTSHFGNLIVRDLWLLVVAILSLAVFVNIVMCIRAVWSESIMSSIMQAVN